MDLIDDQVLLDSILNNYPSQAIDDEYLDQVLSNENWPDEFSNVISDANVTNSDVNSRIDVHREKDEDKNDSVCDSTQLENVQNSFENNDINYYPGDYNFRIVLQQNKMYKASWEFSEMSNRVFIDINKTMMVQFLLDVREKGMEFIIRATPVYLNTDFIDVPVTRCTVHSIEDDPTREAHTKDDECNCEKFNNVGHFIMCLTNGAVYNYDPGTKRHSVSIPFVTGLTGQNSLSILYKFTCKTSCQKGVNRSPISLIFTLENKTGDILGRASIVVKICSCPKRDKNKFESNFSIMPTHLNLSQESSQASNVGNEVLKAQFKTELKKMYKIKNMMEKSLMNIENALEF